MRPRCTLILHGLRQLMNERQATVGTLAQAAGVGYATVQRAVRGYAVSPLIADCIVQALTERSFSRGNRGRRAI